MRFFERVFQLAPPESPWEGAFKMLMLSQFITVPITLNTEYTSHEEREKLLYS